MNKIRIIKNKRDNFAFEYNVVALKKAGGWRLCWLNDVRLHWAFKRARHECDEPTGCPWA